MSSSQPFLHSSPLSQPHSGGGLRKSRFTYKHLSQLSLSSTACPLRVIAHIDLDAFYAQCEMVRLNVPEDQPLAVQVWKDSSSENRGTWLTSSQQWQGLIAINYPARKFGMNRHITITEAKKLCPNLIMQHVATWKEGDEKWAYHKDAFAQIATHKVSLDPYRLESRRILACIKETLPAPPLQRVEKASIDEVFLDLSAQIHSILLERYPELGGPPPYDDPTENLPRPPTTALDWNTDALVDLDNMETEDDDPDWDDIAMQIGSEIVRGVRAAIRENLKYTCSAGIAHNKMIAKLGSAHKKPNQQTIVRNRAVQQFLSGFKFTKIRNLGGKLGDQVVSTFGTDQVTELLGVPIEQLKFKLGDDTGSWVYQIIRGQEYSEVNSRTQIKSMLSAKSFRPSINTFEQAVRWLRIFAADIFSRLVEEGVLENRRRPKTMNLHHRQGGQMRSRQAPIPSGRSIDEALLFEISKTLLGQVIVDGRAWPCANLSLSVGGFEDGPTGNRGIGSFLVKGDEAKAMRATSRDVDDQDSALESGRPGKRRKVDEGGIQKFFAKRDSGRGEHDDEFGAEEEVPTLIPQSSSLGDLEASTPTDEVEKKPELQNHIYDKHKLGIYPDTPKDDVTPSVLAHPPNVASHQASIETYLCTKCNTSLPTANKAEHDDWHFAKDLQDVDRPTAVGSSSTKPSPSTAISGSSNKPATVGAKRGPKKPGGVTDAKGVEKGQKRLVFGR
ncbi:DNA-directed DNA polymerase eta rad30 [Xylographa trunciseda]|nr:DNA-directed DNA polymerase eta rad30 [Xylographa trunciseda]